MKTVKLHRFEKNIFLFCVYKMIKFTKNNMGKNQLKKERKPIMCIEIRHEEFDTTVNKKKGIKNKRQR